MKTNFLSLAAIFAIALFSSNMNAQTTNTVTLSSVPSSATIIAPITITLDNAGLSFGTILRSSGDVTVAATSTSERSAASGPTYLVPTTALNGTAVNSAKFTVKGEAAYTFSIDLPADGDITLTDTATTPNTMAVKTFTSNGVAGTGDTTSALIAGEKTIYVGATLVVGTSQPSGLYTGTFPITVAYN